MIISLTKQILPFCLFLMNRKEEIVNSIENIYNNQKERYNEQLQQLYEVFHFIDILNSLQINIMN